MWICVSPAVFAFPSGGLSVIAAGIVLALASVITLGHPLSMVQEIIRLLMAAFTFFIPWIFGFWGGATLNLRVTSLALLALTAASIAEIHRWRTCCQ
jgi:hypothetical protein